MPRDHRLATPRPHVPHRHRAVARRGRQALALGVAVERLPAQTGDPLAMPGQAADHFAGSRAPHDHFPALVATRVELAVRRPRGAEDVVSRLGKGARSGTGGPYTS